MITIKDWSSFQSYKDRKPPWIRLHKTLLDNFEFHQMSVNARALLPMLWLLASEDKDPVSGCIRDSYEKIAFRLRLDIKDVNSGINEITESGFISIEVMGGGGGHGYLIIETNELHNRNETVKEPPNPVTPETETYKQETEKHIERDGETEPTENLFELIYESYPEKKGKAKAQKHFVAQIKTEQDWKDINYALINYLKEVDRCRKNGHPTLDYQHASTWFNKSWRDYINYHPPAKQSPDGIQKPQQLGKEELKEKIDEQIKFVLSEFDSGREWDINHFHMAVGKMVYEYEQRFGKSPFTERDQGLYNDLKAELELKSDN